MAKEIRLLKPSYLPPGQHELPAGTVVVLPDRQADALIAEGTAELVSPEG